MADAGITTEVQMDGKNLWPHLINQQPIQRKINIAEGYVHDMIDKDDPEASLAYRWCIQGDWKLILCYDGQLEGWGQDTHEDMRQEPIRLYNLAEDPFETNNLYQKHPGQVKRLRDQIESWYALKQRKVLGE